jgi:O-antigen/teichoic acid export membrane protein
MKLGQTSIIHYGSNLLASALGFIATIYISRLLGAEALGIYSLGLAVVSWFSLVGNMGITEAVVKRMSEGTEPSAYVFAGGGMILALYVILSSVIIIFSTVIDGYVGYSATPYIVIMLGVSLGFGAVSSALSGSHLVHISGLLAPLKTGGRASLQIAALTFGLGVAGLFEGYIIAYLLAMAIGVYILHRSFDELRLPARYHFSQIVSYSKYSWLGALRSRSFDWVDIAVLGFFVSQAFIGYYTAAWNIAIFLILFANSISTTLFPEMSKASENGNIEKVVDLLEKSLSYTGLFLIPGLVGAVLLGDRILLIYGESFTQATPVLVILIGAALFQSYQDQLKTTLNALDRPDLSFWLNMLFIVVNVVMNVVLIYTFGWVGAAVATALSVVVSLLAAYILLHSIIEFDIPFGEIGKQSTAALIMGGFVVMLLQIQTEYLQIPHNAIIVVTTVFLSAGVYFSVLYGISAKFRITVQDNLDTVG